MKVLIVGGGLSGICIAHQLLKEKIEFHIIDQGINHSTRIAGGMINPITFRRMIETWRGEELIPVLETFYKEMETRIDAHFFLPIKIRRAFSTEHESILWDKFREEHPRTNFLNPIAKKEDTPSYFKNPFGNGLVNSPGYIDAKEFMDKNHQFFKDLNVLTYSTFDYKDLDTQTLSYKDQKYTHIIFAEGSVGEKNPYFKYLPFKNAKGEILTIAPNIFRKDEILNRKCFILPMKDGTFKLGSTYSWGTDDPSITPEGKADILEKYNELSDIKIEIINHEGGIRPVAADRRPFIGEHPQLKGLYIFNAMGAKGFMIAPYFSIHFVDFLLGRIELDEEVNIKRHEAFYK